MPPATRTALVAEMTTIRHQGPTPTRRNDHDVSGALSFSVGFVSVAYYGKNEAGDGLGPAMPGTNGNGIHMAWEAWGTRNHIEGY